MEETRRWQKDTKDLVEKLHDYPDAFASFRSIVKMGINPRPLDKATPIGIYAFPISCVRSTDDLGIFSDLRYVYIIKPKQNTNILELSTKEAIAYYQELENQAWNTAKIPGLRLTNLLKQAGYDGVIDWGTKTICYDEPCQAVFLGIQTINVLDMFENNARFLIQSR